MESFRGALAAGADAIYLGGRKYGARAYAENFDKDDLIACIRQAHLLERKVYLTVNVATKEEELEDTVQFVRDLYEHGLDGVIAQDLGVISSLRQECPALLLHASTQLSVTSAESVRFLKRLGVCRVVPARELSLKEMAQIKEEEPIEIEAFVHGAMCYSYSGRCLMSSFLGGRSGNRGRCAGTCRLPFSVVDGDGKIIGQDEKRARKGECYPLSMKDLCVLEILPDLIDAGIDSFKIEGRMKKPEYAAGTTAFYRKYVDRYVQWNAEGRKTPWKIDEKDREELYSLYIRSELSIGYYYRKNGRDMVTINAPGYVGANPALLDNLREKYLHPAQLRPIAGVAKLYPGQPAELTLTTETKSGEKAISVTVVGDNVQHARKRPMTEEDISKRLGKTGDTSFYVTQMQVFTGENVFMPVVSLNALRRKAIGALEEKILKENASLRLQEAKENEVKYLQVPKWKKHSTDYDESSADSNNLTESMQNRHETIIWASVLTAAQLDAAVHSGVRKIFIEDLDYLRAKSEQYLDSTDAEIYLALPHIFRSEFREKIIKTLQSDDLRRFNGVLARTLEELELLREMGYSGEIIADSSIYTWNKMSSEVVLDQVDRDVLSLELSASEIKPLLSSQNHRRILQVYGRVPMMVSANCVRKTELKCRHREENEELLRLEDRKHAKFPVRCACGYCYNIIYNCVPLSLHKFVDHPVMRMCSEVMLNFTTESGEETTQIISNYRGAFEGEAFDQRVLTQFTNGHFIKSVI